MGAIEYILISQRLSTRLTIGAPTPPPPYRRFQPAHFTYIVSFQVRYAAMDAYCLVLIYDVCCRWAQRLDVSIEEILSRQEPIRVSPPLLSEDF